MRRLTLLPILAACGPTFIADDFPIDAGPFAFDATVDAPSFGDGAVSDVGVDVTLFNGGGPFACLGCICDGTLDMCRFLTGRGHAPLDDASSMDAGTCVPDASACVPIPVHCLPKPTCECIMADAGPGCGCSVDPSGNGLVVECIVP